MPTPRERERAILQAIWRKAYTTREPVVITAKSENDAIRLRFQLNHTAALVKKLGVAGEIDLYDAVEHCICRVQGNIVRVEYRDVSRLEGFATAIGLTEEELETPGEREVREALERLTEGEE